MFASAWPEGACADASESFSFRQRQYLQYSLSSHLKNDLMMPNQKDTFKVMI